MGIPWWAWPLLALVAFMALAVRFASSYRASLRDGFRAFLRERRPDLRVASESPDSFRIDDAAGTEVGTLNLRSLYEASPRDAAEREALYGRLLGAIEQAAVVGDLSAAQRDSVLPRLVNSGMLTSLRAASDTELPAVDLGAAGLHVVMVLDGADSVAYLGEAELNKLGLKLAEAFDVAKANLALRFDPAIVRRALDSQDVVMAKALDSYDAARLLLVPQHLDADERLVAAIPDRNTLVLTRVPADDDWRPLRRLAQTAAGDPLCTEPLIVSRDGIVAAGARGQ